MSTEAVQRHPEWRKYPSAVVEGVVFVGDSLDAVEGKARYQRGPSGGGEGRTVYAKGDHVPDFDYAVLGASALGELYTVLDDRLDTSKFDDGEIMLRLVGFNKMNNWSLEMENEAVDDIISSVSLSSLESERDSPSEADDTDEADEPEENDEEPALDPELREALDDADPEEIEELRDLIDESED